MLRSRLIAPVLIAAGLGLAAGAAGLTGCTVHGQVATGAYVEGPSLAYVGPDLYVVADYDEPVFYTDGSYWLYRGGYWYRSGSYDSGWVIAGRVPARVAHISRPHYYVHYHARRVYRPRQIQVRDHRSQHEYVNVRDHRRPDNRPQRTGYPTHPRRDGDHDRGHDHDRDHHDRGHDYDHDRDHHHDHRR